MSFSGKSNIHTDKAVDRKEVNYGLEKHEAVKGKMSSKSSLRISRFHT